MCRITLALFRRYLLVIGEEFDFIELYPSLSLTVASIYLFFGSRLLVSIVVLAFQGFI